MTGPPSPPPGAAARLPLVIGVGNEHRSDDGAGLRAVRLLLEEGPVAAEVRVASGEGTSLLALWQGARRVIVVDAVRSGAPPGTLRRLDALAEPLPRALFPSSTHSFGVAEAVELARALGQLPPALTVLGIEGKSFAPGAGLSPEVEEAAHRAARALREELEEAP